MTGKKATCKKRMKRSIQEGKPRARRNKILTLLGLGFLISIVTVISL
jgi:hypothetical protein